MVAWLERYTAEHGAGFVETKEGPAGGTAALSPDKQRRVVRVRTLQQWEKSGPNAPMPIADHERDRLLAKLSPKMRAKLEGKTPAEQAQIIADWLQKTAKLNSTTSWRISSPATRSTRTTANG